MTTEMNWSHDFCLFCDRQISEGAYCSQACRLADLEKASLAASEPASPLSFSSSASSTASYASGSGSGSGFYLPPAYQFPAYKSGARIESPPQSPRYYTANQSSYFAQQSSSPSTSPSFASSERSLSPSASRSSLSSISGTPNAQGLSPQAAQELLGYVSSFDQVRDLKRRLTLA